MATAATGKFTYSDRHGLISTRTVTVHVIDRYGYFQGHCHHRGDTRTFAFGRILGNIVDADTGEVLTALEWEGKLRRALGASNRRLNAEWRD